MRVLIALFLLSPWMVTLTGCSDSSGSGDEASERLLSPLSGSIAIEANSRIDQDTMDQLGREGATPANAAQTLPASFVMAGYVSRGAGTYPAAASACQTKNYQADPADTFSVPLAAGETIVLKSFGTCGTDVALELLVEGYPPVRTSGRDETAQFRLNSGPTDDYQVVVRNVGSLPARYMLLKTAGTTQQNAAYQWSDHRFEEGEAIVTLKESAPGQASALSAQAKLVARKLGERTWLRKMPATARAQAGGRPVPDTLDWIRSLRQQPDVEFAAPNYRMQSQSPVGEPLYSKQWHYDVINGPVAWQIEPSGGSGVDVAVLDTGLFRESDASGWHPDLNRNVVSGRDYVDNDFDPRDPGSSVGGNVYHGTHVAGTIASVIDNKGSGGVAFGASLLPVRVLGEGGTGSSADLIEAIAWLVNGSGGQPPRAQVVNMSLGGLPEIPQLESAIAAGVNKGMLFVAAAGNGGTRVKSYPAASSNVLAVSAVDGARNLASYSNYGSWIDLAAPGGDAGRDANTDGEADLVWSTSAAFESGAYKPDYRGLQGTSMAAPHVSGVLAMMKAQKPDLDYGDVRALLASGELTEYSGRRSDQLGYGVLDAAKAVSAASQGFTGPVLSASPAVVSLSNEGVEAQLVELNVYGSAPVTGVSVESQPEWLEVESDFSGEPFILNVALLRDRLTPDVPARGDIVVSYNLSKELRIPVIGQLITDEKARNAGRHFVLLVDTEPNEQGVYLAEAQVTTTVEDGEYLFAFEADDGAEPRSLREVTPGDYYLVAGTDIDGDGFICQAGEACAEYPVAGLREVVTVRPGQVISDLRMTTGFSRPTISAASPDVLPRPGFQGYRLINSIDRVAATNSQLKALK
ncbi:S8 family serine peptidase [Marinobacter litoralis]|uniref:S8 family serine peptidase n=1 Tax=Marinobacter litoralis TaxID=187981 RepID=UPI0018EDD2B3|nr:S8 family serine peptidase [Marinobacter litoralis]MBJ6137195.1 S8 family serine peptidase [Marinobacter litoralis]